MAEDGLNVSSMSLPLKLYHHYVTDAGFLYFPQSSMKEYPEPQIKFQETCCVTTQVMPLFGPFFYSSFKGFEYIG